MRILHWISGKDFGGSKQVFIDYQRGLAELGQNIIPVIRRGAQLKKRLLQHAIQPIEVSYWRSTLPGVKRATLNTIRAVIAEQTPELILLHKPKDLYLFRQAGCQLPIVLVVHGYQRSYLEQADGLIAVSSDVKRHLRRFLQQPILIASNFLVTLPEAYPITWETPIQLGYLGHFRWKKGVQDLLTSLAIVKESGVDFECKIAGRGRMKLYLYLLLTLKGLRKQVKFIGWLDKVEAFYQAIDVLLLPSRSESFGKVLIEAMARQKLVIATRSGGPQEIISNQKNGLLVNRQHPGELAAVVVKVIADSSLYDPLRMRARQQVKQQFHSLSVAPKIVRFLSDISQGRGA